MTNRITASVKPQQWTRSEDSRSFIENLLLLYDKLTNNIFDNNINYYHR